MCDCGIQWLKNFTTHSRNLMEVAAVCSEPAALSGVALTDVSDDDFHCPVAANRKY